MQIPVKSILPNPDQPRTTFDDQALAGLARSMKENGLVNAICVEKRGGEYVLVDGERRLRAAKLLKWQMIEATVRKASNHQGTARLSSALVANVQRSAMGVIDEAWAYARLAKELGSMEAVAERVGVSAATVSLRLTLLELAEPVRKLYNDGRVPIDPAWLFRLAKLPHESQVRVITMGVTRGWNGRAFGRMITRELKGAKKYVIQKREKAEIKFEGHFDALALAPKWRSLPEGVIRAAKQTCRECPLYREASASVCKQCPLPDFLRRLVADPTLAI
jgi:ParB family chromosome partitioning protein